MGQIAFFCIGIFHQRSIGQNNEKIRIPLKTPTNFNFQHTNKTIQQNKSVIMRGMRLNHKVTHLGIVPTTTTITTRTLSPLSLSLASSSSLPVTHQQAHQKFHSCVHHSYAKKKSVYNHNNKVRKPSPKTQNVIHLQYDPRVDETPKKQEFIQRLQEKDRERIQQLIMQFDQIASASRILHTESMFLYFLLI